MNLSFWLFEESILDRLSKWNVLTGLIFAVLGFLLMVFCSKLTDIIFKSKSEDVKGKYKVRFKVLSMLIVLVGCCLVLFIDI
ncbi:MAG: hypothetical protein FWG51_02590 [Firmicutes bacterium]|nr:hypothetical protein [Bacillota bacterium]